LPSSAENLEQVKEDRDWGS